MHRNRRTTTRRLAVGGVASALAAFGLGLGTPTAGAAPGPLVSCPQRLECGVVTVPLDHVEPSAGRLGLVVSRLRPKEGQSAGTLLFLTGGPGQAGIARDSAATMHRLRALSLNREVISVDLRGTGRSGALNCPGLQGPAEAAGGGLEAAIDECARRLGPARRHYDTGQVIDDLEVVRRSLGVERWAIGGVSYGTYVATRYARAYPDRVDKLLLDSLVPPEGVSSTGAESLAATGRIVGEACPPASCGRISGALAADVARLEGILSRRAIPGTLVGRDGTASLAGVGGPGRPGVLYEALLAGDLHDSARAAFPAAVRAALSGDATLLARIVGQGESEAVHPTRQSVAAQVASLCEDSDLPWQSDTPVEARRRALEDAANAAAGSAPAAPFSPLSVTALSPAALCLGWPDAPEAAPEDRPLPAVPTLVVAGGADVRTPLEGAYRLASRSPDAEVLVVPHAGHSVLSRGLGCVDTAVRRFFSGLPTGRRCSQLSSATTPLPPPPSSFSGFRQGLVDRRPQGVTLSALRATLGDVAPSIEFGRFRASGPRATGLRGGTVDVRIVAAGPIVAVTLIFRDFTYVPGVRVSGVVKQLALAGLSGLPAEGRLTVASPLGRADARIGKAGIRLRVRGSRPVVAPTPVSLGSFAHAAI